MTRDPNPQAGEMKQRTSSYVSVQDMNLVDALAEVQRLRAERDALSHQLEADRTTVADAVTRLRRELDSRHWLTESRGSYEWDDDRYREEFFFAGRALIAAMEPLVKLAANWAGCPRTTAEVAKARIDKDARIAELEAERDEALRSVQVLMETSAENLRLATAREAERDKARAQAARLAEALKLVARNAFQNIATVRWEHLEDRPDYERVADDICSKLAFDIDYINTALASTDARAWMREQKAAELERLKATDLRGTVEVYAKNGYPYDEDVIYVSAIDARIAELRRKEGA